MTNLEHYSLVSGFVGDGTLADYREVFSYVSFFQQSEAQREV